VFFFSKKAFWFKTCNLNKKHIIKKKKPKKKKKKKKKKNRRSEPQRHFTHKTRNPLISTPLFDPAMSKHPHRF